MSRRLYTRSVTIDATVEQVFDYLKDPATSWVSMGTKIHDVQRTPDGVGTTFEWEDRMFGFHVSGRNEFAEFVPNRKLVITSSKGFVFTFDVEPVDTGTRLTVGVDAVPSNWAAGTFDAVAMKLTEHDMDVWLDDVKAEVETGSPRHREVERHLVVTRAVTVQAPVEKVYAFLTDPSNTLGAYAGTTVTDVAPSPEVVNQLEQSCAYGSVLAAGLRALNSNPAIREDELRHTLEGAGRAVAHQLERYLPALATIASAASLMGLLGTVVGMIEIFGSQNASGGSNPMALAHGISVALYNTAFGLIVALPALIFWRYFRARVDDYLLRMEIGTEQFLRHLARFCKK